MQPRTKKIIVALALLAILVGLVNLFGGGEKTRAPTSQPSASDSGSRRRETVTSASSVVALPTETATSDDTDAARALAAAAKWGSRRGELGHERPQEGNAEGPMSFALAGRNLVVLDQLNRRLARYDADGKLLATNDVPQTAQDIAIAADGTAALLDRLSGKSVRLVDARGRSVGELALPARAGDPGMLTGVFVDGTTIYVEKEHGALVPIGTTDGQPLDDAPSLSGRPTKDGALLLTAAITSSAGGQVSLNAFDRKKDTIRFARLYQFPRPARGIVLLDSDARGKIYLGVAGAGAEAQIACIDPSDGRAWGRVNVPLSATPEESFRDLAVSDDGSIVVAVRSDEGVEYRVVRCP